MNEVAYLMVATVAFAAIVCMICVPFILITLAHVRKIQKKRLEEEVEIRKLMVGIQNSLSVLVEMKSNERMKE